MLIKLSGPNELEISKYLDSLHFRVPWSCIQFFDPFVEAML
jgi:hypothetical protein